MRAVLLIIFAICMLGTCRAQEFTMRCPVITIADSGAHGQNVITAFNTYVKTGYDLNYVNGGTDLHAIDHADNIGETNIISASAKHVIGDALIPEGKTASDKLASSNSLFIGSLENAGVLGWQTPEGFYVAEYNQGSSYYYMIDNPDAIDQAIFVGWRKKFASGSSRGYVDMENGFVEDNLDNIIFVTSDYEYTSNNTPALAGVAMNILAANPGLTPEQLKVEIFALTSKMNLTIRDPIYKDGESEYIETRLLVNVIEL